MNSHDESKGAKPVVPVFVKIKQGDREAGEMRFTSSFTIGRCKDCDLQIKDKHVSRNHVKVTFEGQRWWIKDLDSANGTYVDGKRIKQTKLTGKIILELGVGGPVFILRVEEERELEAKEDMTARTEEFSSATQIIQRIQKSKSDKAGEYTIMFRKAFEHVHKKKSRKFKVIISVSILLLIVSFVYIAYQEYKLAKLREQAADLFYAMKSLELEIAGNEEVEKDKLRGMEKEYDTFVKELGIFENVSEEQRAILKIARLFGECEVNVPTGFTKEVFKYIEDWKLSDKLKNSVQRANAKGYDFKIKQVMEDYNLPPHFFYLALQESEFKDDAVGVWTRFGYAKGIWQFIPETAERYGLKPGPLEKTNKYDPQDERFDFEKATTAAARYLKYISNTEAQASGLLVMASYNWGEGNVINIIRKMPKNPKDRNFWRLLSIKNIPRQTYNYVFSIFSAAVICENPHHFGFDFECPELG